MLNFIIYLTETINKYKIDLINNDPDVTYLNITSINYKDNSNKIYFSNKKSVNFLYSLTESNINKYLYKYNTTKCYLYNIIQQKFELIDIQDYELYEIKHLLRTFIYDTRTNIIKTDTILKTLFKITELNNFKIQNKEVKLVYNNDIFTLYILHNAVYKIMKNYNYNSELYNIYKNAVQSNIYKTVIHNLMNNYNRNLYLDYFIPEYYKKQLFDIYNQEFYLKVKITSQINFIKDKHFDNTKKYKRILLNLVNNIIQDYNNKYCDDTYKSIIIPKNYYKIMYQDSDLYERLLFIDLNIYIHVNYLYDLIMFSLYDTLINEL